MPAPRRFCAEESAAIGDPLVGSAAHAVRNLLISWPRAKWVRSLRQASDMSVGVSAMLEEIAESGRRVNLIHRRGQDPRRHRVFLMPECQAYDVSREELSAFLKALHQGASLAPWRGGDVEGSLILCCTHGKKDKCCAKFGYRTYRAMADEAQRQAHPFDVWESTHLGGCRLAASAVVFPQLRKYGRIGKADIPLLLQAEAGNRPYLPCYRGDSTLEPAEQCAEAAALKWLQDRRLHGDIHLEKGKARISESRLDVPVTWQSDELTGRLLVTCIETELIRLDTCADIEGQGATTSKAWRAVQVKSSCAEA